jgi:acyl-CoA synthetase (AMP-forming)/AMP-acid ligase II
MNNISLPYSSFVEILRFRSDIQSDSIAFVYLDFTTGVEHEHAITYAQLDASARSVAAQLQCLNLCGKRVLLLHPHGLDFIIAFLGCIYSGTIAVPVCNPRVGKPIVYLEMIARNCQPEALLSCQTISPEIVNELKQSPVLGYLPWIYTDIGGYSNSHLWKEFYPHVEMQSHIQYTSGSFGLTSSPKGVLLTHGNLINNSESIQQGFGNNSSSVGISWLPLYHNMGLIGNVLQPIFVGSRVIFMSPQSFIQQPLRWLKTISKYQGTISGGPNFAYELCIRKIKPVDREELSLQSWEVAYCGAEMVRAVTITNFQEFFEPCGFSSNAFFPCYGLAEATLIVTGGTRQVATKIRKVDSEALREGNAYLSNSNSEFLTFVSCGWTFPGQKVLIVDPETRQQCTPGRVGEVWINGPSVGQGYLQLPELTEIYFLARLAGSDSEEGPFLRTGDLGYLYEGELYITGCLMDLIHIHGQKHYPQDIERTVQNSHPSLQRNATVAFSTEIEREEKLVIIQEVERINIQTLNLDNVKASISDAVMRYHNLQTHKILLLKSGNLPKSSNGNVQRELCLNYFLNGVLKQFDN